MKHVQEHQEHICFVSPAPWVLDRLKRDRKKLAPRLAGLSKAQASKLLAEELGLPHVVGKPRGFNDGAFYPAPGGVPVGVPGGPSPAPAPALEAMPPTVGQRHALVLLVDFPDLKGTQTIAHFERLLFGTAAKSLSMRSYYDAASLQKLAVDGEIVGWLTMPQPLQYYTAGKSATGSYPHNGQRLVEHALDAAFAAGVHLGRFDVDGDGELDGLIVIHAGAGAEAEGSASKRPHLIWSHKWNIRTPRTMHGVTAWAYTLQPEDGRVGVFCHEFGHFLGLPDLYDTVGTSEGVGEWCVMGAGSWCGGGDKPSTMSAWCRLQLGWTTAVVPTAGGKHKIQPATKTGEVVKLPISGRPKEYFLLESRKSTGLDRALPGQGLLIWHIDDAQSDNDDPQRYMVGVEQADDNQDLEFGGDRGDAGDPFPGSTGNTVFGNGSSPNSKTYPPRMASRVDIRNIAFAVSTGVATVELGTAPTPAPGGLDGPKKLAKSGAKPARSGKTRATTVRRSGVADKKSAQKKATTKQATKRRSAS